MKKQALKALLVILTIASCIGCGKIIASFSIKLDKKTSLDRSEVDVSSWLSYYTWLLEHRGILEAQRVMPDSTAVEPKIWKFMHQKSNTRLLFVGDYTDQPVGYFYDTSTDDGTNILYIPITGLTFEQVSDFCKWRTSVQGEGKIRYRLPSPDEWKNYARKSLTESERLQGFRDSLQNNTCPKFNFNYNSSCNGGSIKSNLTQAFSYYKDELGASDIFGNVSEMTSIKGIAKGGNYLLHANQCHPDSVQYYTKPEKWLGFRCIAEKI